MAAAFVGRRIGVKLKNGRHVEGTLSEIDAESGQLTMDDCVSESNGRSVRLSAIVVHRADIGDLHMVALDSNADGPCQQPRHSPPTASQSQQANTTAKLQRKSSKKNAHTQTNGQASAPGKRASATPGSQPPAPAPASRTTSRNKSRTSNKPNSSPPSALNTPSAATTTTVDGEFDFSAGLLQFDKAKIFQEIREADHSDPSLRLVAHNKKCNVADNKYTTKLLPSENVLDQSEREKESSTYEDAMRARRQGQSSVSSSSPPPPPPVGATSAQAIPSTSFDSTNTTGSFRTLESRICCPALSSQSYNDVLAVANIESGPNAAQRIENGARGIAQYILQHLAASPRNLFGASSNPSDMTIVILCGSGTKGQYGFRTGAHLANKGVNVCAWLSSGEHIPANVDFHRRLFTAAGGKLTKGADQLPAQPSLIIDALLDSEPDKVKRKQPSSEQGVVVSYINSNNAPTLSVDAPSYWDVDTASPLAPNHIFARFSAVLGVFKPIHRLPRPTGELVLIDIGLPSVGFQQAQVDWPAEVFGSDWIAPCIREQ